MAAIEYGDIVRTGPDTLAGRYLRGFWQPAKDGFSRRMP